MSRRISGFKPTGSMHLGNYLGAIRPMVAGQRDDESHHVHRRSARDDHRA